MHHGSVVVLGPDGSVAGAAGDPSRPIFPRSSNKPIQALGMLRAGLSLPNEDDTDADLAIACGSHNGEAAHVARVHAILAEFGLGEDDLGCPADYPAHPATRDRQLRDGIGRRRLTMNCSGKHAAMLATCTQRGWSLSDYLDAEHPLQVAIRETVEETSGESIVGTAVDGCGAPLFALSLTGLATAFRVLVTAPGGSHERRIADAMRAHPFLVAGTGREDTRLMGAVPGLLSKAGAEGVYAAALPDGSAIALKIDDGHDRARLPVMVGALQTLGIANAELAALAEPVIEGGGRPVGSARLLPGVLG